MKRQQKSGTERETMVKELILHGEKLTAKFDAESGVLTSLMSADGCEFIGNANNTSYPEFLAAPQWMGDVLIRTYAGDQRWLTQKTSLSGDIRRVAMEDDTVCIDYTGVSSHNNGLRNVALYQRFTLDGGRLIWELTVKNPTEKQIEIGELSLPFLTNNDFTGLFMKDYPAIRPSDNAEAQRLWHTDRVMQHIHIAHHSSYVFLQRPSGAFPGLLFSPLGDDTALESSYQIDPTIGDQFSCTFEGPYYVSVYSAAARKVGRWLGHRDYQRYGLCGHRSLLLDPGMSQTLAFAFTAIDEYAAIGRTLYEDGQLEVIVAPSMTAPLGTDIRLLLRCKEEPQIMVEANGAQMISLSAEGDEYQYLLKMTTVGQKRVRVRYGSRQTLLYFFAIPETAQAVRDHAQFLIENQYYQNKDDPFGRYHAFLAYDSMYETFFLEGDESWQVAASDEFCLPPAMFLAEKNVCSPNKKEIAVLEEYIDDFLFNVLQNPETYEVKRGCYWEEERPSGQWNWSFEKASQTSRSFNYILVADIYHSMYKIGKLYGLTTHRSPEEYLEMAARSSIMGFTRGFHTHMAGPGGFGSIWLLRDLKAENSPYYEEMYRVCAKFAADNYADPYPYGSELYTDQTAHHQIYAYMKEFGYHDKALQAITVSKALRGGWQPSWYGYGKEQRGSVCCWYGTPHNSYTLLRGYETTRDDELLSLGFGGLLGFLTCLRDGGLATGWYTWWPDRQGFDPRSMDTDLGMYALMKIFKSYVSEHPQFGLYGWCCDTEMKDGILTVIPHDGLQKRLYLAPWSIDIELEKAELKKVTYDPDTRRLTLLLTDPTGLVPQGSGCITVQGRTVMAQDGLPLESEISLIC